jgi:hypothetical protein
MSKNEPRSSRFLLCIILWFCPLITHAVFISEVAWMGSAISANHEWIELRNDGPARSVDGWVLTDGANLTISLSGTVPASSYVVLERTSDASAPGSAFLIYTGALVNTGSTLRLLDDVGAVVDQVAGGADWEGIGGDNDTKQTAQYSSDGWITADATPGAPPPSATVVSESDESAEGEVVSAASQERSTRDASASKRGGSSGDSVILELPDITLQLQIDAQSIGYVNQPIPFSVEASGIGQSLIDSLRYEWNFGDTTIGSGVVTEHTYSFPGTYLVTVYGEYKRQRQVASHEITILPVAVSLTANAVGDVQVNNDAPYDIDLSGYRLVGHSEVVFPPRSVLLSGQTITLPRERVRESVPVMLALYDAAGTLVASRLPDSRGTVSSQSNFTTPVAVPDGPVLTPTPRISALATSRPDDPDASKLGTVDEDGVLVHNDGAIIPPTSSQLAGGFAADVPRAERLTYAALVGTILLAVLGIYLVPRRNDS